MQTLEFIRSQVAAVNEMLDIATQELDDELINWHPGGTANTIAQLLAHVVSGQDMLVNDKLLVGGGRPLHESGWAEKTGIPLERPLIWQRDAWRLNLPAFNDYRLAVRDCATRLVDSLSEADLDREASWFRGPPRPVATLLQIVYINHGFGHCGEISAIKGMRGLKGLPF